MRKQLLRLFLPTLAVALVGAAGAQNTETAAPKRAALLKVAVVRGADGVNLELSTRGQVTPRLGELVSPARVVLDLPDTVAVTSETIIVNENGVKRVRVGMDGQRPPNARVVVDLDQPCHPEIVSSNGKLVLALHTAASAAKLQTNTLAPAVTAPVASAAISNQSALAAADNFVFVEPSYKPKTDASVPDQAMTPVPQRALVAAAKFVEKSDSDLLPTPSASLAAQDAPAAPQPAVNLAAEQRNQAKDAGAASIGPKYTGEPISVNLKDVDLKDFFRLIHEISGLNVVLDPAVKGNLTIVLDDVPWDQALDIVLKNNDLARQLEGNVLRIATVDTLRKEAESRRAELEAEALAVEKVTKTRYLSYARAKDIVPTLKQFITQRGSVIADERTNALIIQDIPGVIPGIDRLISQLDRKTQQVEIEARVVAATRSFARDIGTQLGFGLGKSGPNSTTSIGGASQVGPSSASTFGINPAYQFIGTSTPTATTGVQIPLFSNLASASPTSGFSFLTAGNTLRIDAVLTMAESRGLLKILSRPRIVTQNNIQGIVRQGVRVPIVTQAQLGGPPTVTYVDAFLRLTVTPQITSENTIFLNVDVENTTPDFGQEVQGNPTLITQQATTQVLVTDGGTVVIGGVIQSQNSINIDQVPLLGNIPFLGNLFKHRQVSTSTQELIFFLTPRIIQT